MSPDQVSSSGSIKLRPFSEGFRIPVKQAWSLLLIYSIYRIGLAGLFAILSTLGIGPSQPGK